MNASDRSRRQRLISHSTAASKAGVDGVDPCRGDLADREITEVRVEVAIEHRSGLTNRGRRPPGRSDRRIYLHLTNDWLADEYKRASALIDIDNATIVGLLADHDTEVR